MKKIQPYRVLPHRIEAGARAGECRECGQHSLSSAPDSCTRCALERMRLRGHPVQVNPVDRFEQRAAQVWRDPARAIRSGAVQAGQFYLFVGHLDGGSLTLPLGELSAQQCATGSAHKAQQIAEQLTQRYQQVWVVTTVGCWSAVRTGERA